MKLFLNDKAIYTVSNAKFFPFTTFDNIIFPRTSIKPELLKGNVLITDATPDHARDIMIWLQNGELASLNTIVMSSDNHASINDYIQSKFRVVKAAGGLVLNNGKVLMMFRRGKWDLPKGKIDPGEDSKEAAVREVEEECGVKAKIIDKICSTWHNYSISENQILKRTEWYLMESVDDSQLSAQTEEDIEIVEWKNHEEVAFYLKNSFESIREVFNNYFTRHTERVSQ